MDLLDLVAGLLSPVVHLVNRSLDLVDGVLDVDALRLDPFDSGFEVLDTALVGARHSAACPQNATEA